MIKLIPDNTKIDFIGTRWIGFTISLLLIALTFGLVYERGLNLGIDFAGGILMEIRLDEPADLTKMRAALGGESWGEVSLQTFGDARDVLIRVETSDTVEQADQVVAIKSVLGEVAGAVEYRKIDYVGPTVGQELIRSGALALALAMAAMMVYIWFRFEWQFGLGGILALTHDAILLFGFYAVTGYDFGLTSIAAILTVIGYSINDSVVIYDRIRENLRKYKKMPLPELINLSVNETLSRTVVTGLTTIMAATVLGIFGGEVIEGFSYALVFGVVVGTYSSVYISAPILLYFDIRRQSDAASQNANDPA